MLIIVTIIIILTVIIIIITMITIIINSTYWRLVFLHLQVQTEFTRLTQSGWTEKLILLTSAC